MYSLVSGGERVKRASLVSGFSLFLLTTNKETQTMSVAVSVCVVWFRCDYDVIHMMLMLLTRINVANAQRN